MYNTSYSALQDYRCIFLSPSVPRTFRANAFDTNDCLLQLPYEILFATIKHPVRAEWRFRCRETRRDLQLRCLKRTNREIVRHRGQDYKRTYYYLIPVLSRERIFTTLPRADPAWSAIGTIGAVSLVLLIAHFTRCRSSNG